MNKIKGKFNIKEDLFLNKKYLIIYILSLILFSISFFNINNYINPKAELIILALLIVIGSIVIVYSSKHEKELHKISLVIILLFGLLTVFLNPTLIICDENEHFARSDMISQGNLIPSYIENKGYVVSELVFQLGEHRGETFINSPLTSEKIINENTYFNGGFPQNPFYGYLISGLGVLLAKLLDLSIIWSMWLGRLFNLIFYAGICSLAIKKAPIYKMPLLVVACLPLSIFQSASFSVDGIIYCLSILAVAYFIYMYHSSSVEYKDMGIFFFLLFLVSLFKFPYILFSFLIFIIPKEKFMTKKMYYLSRIIPFLMLILTMCFSLFYAAPQLKNTIRQEHFIHNNVSPSGQIEYIFNHLPESIILFSQSFNFITEMIIDLFRFSHMEWTYNSPLLSFLYLIFFTCFSLFYPNKINLKKNDKIKVFVILFLIYMMIIFIQYLSWAPVGYSNLDMIIGVYARYYVPLLLLIPLISSTNPHGMILKCDYMELKTILIVIIFLSGFILLTTSVFY